jgi:hypothetical protein
MEDKEFPPEFKNMMKERGVRAVFVSDIVSPHPRDCPNCGGVKFLYILIATIGPMDSPIPGRGIVNHSSEGKWWGGKGFMFPCPKCGGREKTTTPGSIPAQGRMDELTEKMNYTNI